MKVHAKGYVTLQSHDPNIKRNPELPVLSGTHAEQEVGLFRASPTEQEV